MQIKIDDEVVFVVSETEEKIVNSLIPDCKDWIKAGPLLMIQNKINSAMAKLDEEWLDGGKLESNGVAAIPTERDARATLIFSQPNYKDRKAKDLVAE